MLEGSRIISEQWGNHHIIYVYDETGAPVGMYYRTSSYAEGTFDVFYFEKNLQGDIIGVYNSSGTLLALYDYDAWGNCTAQYASGATSTGVVYNPFRYRGYYYDIDLGLYYLNSRYYDANTGRFINADGELSNIGGDLLGNNLYIYCFNSPFNMIDPDGNWPKWMKGLFNVASGVTQMVAGGALGAFASWTGIGAVAAGFLIVNGAATTTQGIGQIVNDVTESEVFREDNIIRTGVEEIGHLVGGDTGAQIAGGTYDVATVAANLYAGKVSLEKSMPKIIKSKVFSVNNGYGFKVGKNIEMFYRNPKAAGGPGGTIFSYKGTLGKFRIDWDPAHGFHCHPPGH